MPPSPDQAISAVRQFSRFYTGRIGALHEGLLQSRFSLAEARVLYELANRQSPSASEISADLDLDPGYLSRILQRFERDGLLVRTQSQVDRRQSSLVLTAAGHAAFTPLDTRSRAEIAGLLANLPPHSRTDLVACMGQIEMLLAASRERFPWTLRPSEAGDIGWVIERHGAVYAAEYGFDHRFEALVAQVAGGFLADHDPARERCWIAEGNGARLGSVFLVRQSDTVGKLRLLLVDPAARGLGIGRALVHACMDAARAAGYRQLSLWTNDVLLAARAIYAAAGFRLVDSAPHADFGPPMRGENWMLDLA
jgi:DNA-binding MarR family transcriptional regulator/predicted GNAT family acetyltransferase